ncbi:hypothetical protein LSTR_LSTR010959 [Laodelphax striatellus]|uniref:Uncharacterized protein n=1 Tax=Laodelphax striatellus TaxID=195883 RepID=A0A482XVQ5_LAOST|nr:hypothetical protein LSTR_LSTR010959 [Laodelphax striatellus]
MGKLFRTDIIEKWVLTCFDAYEGCGEPQYAGAVGALVGGRSERDQRHDAAQLVHRTQHLVAAILLRAVARLPHRIRE